MTTGPALGVPGHHIALFVWASMVVMLLLFLAVVITIAAPWTAVDVPPDLLLGAVVVTSAAGVVLSRVVPPRLSPRLGGGRGEIAALTRLIVGWSFCEAVAIFPLFAYLMTRDWRLLPVFTADVAALVAYCPTRERWERLSRATAAPGRSSRMVR